MAENNAEKLIGIERVISDAKDVIENVLWIQAHLPYNCILPSRIETYINSRNRFETGLSLYLEEEGGADHKDIVKILKGEEVDNG